MTSTTTEAQRAFFRANGYLSVAAITTPGELAWLREIYEPLVEDARALTVIFHGRPSEREAPLDRHWLRTG